MPSFTPEQEQTPGSGPRFHDEWSSQNSGGCYSASSSTRSSLDRDGCRSLRKAFASI